MANIIRKLKYPTNPIFPIRIKDQGVPVNLTGATVTVSIESLEIEDSPCTIIGPVSGKCYWQAGDGVLTRGTHIMTVKVVNVYGDQQTLPCVNYIILVII